MTLYEKINELEEKKQSLVEEANSKGTPAEEREKLLKQVILFTKQQCMFLVFMLEYEQYLRQYVYCISQVKDDNEEIRSIEKRWVAK